MRRFAFALLLPLALWSASARADYRVTRDHGGLVDEYKAKYAAIRDRGERVIIDGICNSACTPVLGIVPLNRVCDAAREPRLPPRLLRQEPHLRHEGDELRGRARGSGLVLSGDREGLD